MRGQFQNPCARGRPLWELRGVKRFIDRPPQGRLLGSSDRLTSGAATAGQRKGNVSASIACPVLADCSRCRTRERSSRRSARARSPAVLRRHAVVPSPVIGHLAFNAPRVPAARAETSVGIALRAADVRAPAPGAMRMQRFGDGRGCGCRLTPQAGQESHTGTLQSATTRRRSVHRFGHRQRSVCPGMARGTVQYPGAERLESRSVSRSGATSDRNGAEYRGGAEGASIRF